MERLTGSAYYPSYRLLHASFDDEEECDEEEGGECYSEPEPEEGDPGYHEPEEGDEGYKEPEKRLEVPPVFLPPFFRDPGGPKSEPGSGAFKLLVSLPDLSEDRDEPGNFVFPPNLVQWIAYADSCPACTENMLAGVQKQDEVFPSGHQQPPAHRNCRCKLETIDIYHTIQDQGILLDIGVNNNTIGANNDSQRR